MANFKTAHQAAVERGEKTPDRPFLHQPVGGQVATYTWSQCVDISSRLAAAFNAIGLDRGDKIALLSKNCAEWILTDLAIAMAGMISVPVYPTASKETISYVIGHSGAKAIVIGKLDDPQVAAESVPEGVRTIAMPYKSIDCAYEWQALLENHEPLQVRNDPDPGDVMTILYTSGSTGQPKGVVLTYGAYHYAGMAALVAGEGHSGDRALSYLPLAHVTERTCTAGPAIYSGFQLFFVESLDTFRRDLRNARVTTFISVPRLWVQFQSAVHAKIPPKKLALILKIPILGNVVARKIRKDLGFSHARRFGSGSAPISPLTLKWYQRIGVNIGEGWGMSETSGLSCGNVPFHARRIGTIGVPVEGTEIRLTNEGEILLRSPGLFKEYYKQPELTREVFDDDGFFHTGDKGEWIEKSQAYRITGRVKDMFKSSKGKYVVPVPIEAKLSGNPLIEQTCVMGSGLRAPIAVVVLTAAASSTSRTEIEESLTSTLGRVNDQLESHENLERIVIANDEWTIGNGLLTPTMKIRRSLLEGKYQRLIGNNCDQRIQWE